MYKSQGDICLINIIWRYLANFLQVFNYKPYRTGWFSIFVNKLFFDEYVHKTDGGGFNSGAAHFFFAFLKKFIFEKNDCTNFAEKNIISVHDQILHTGGVMFHY